MGSRVDVSEHLQFTLFTPKAVDKRERKLAKINFTKTVKESIMELMSMPVLEKFFCAVSAEEEEESTYITHQLGMRGLVSFAGLFSATLTGPALFTLCSLRFLYPPNIPKMLNIAVMPVKIIKLAYLVA